jgi:hypothetical protein
LVGKKSSESCEKIQINGEVVCDKRTIANEFNDPFVNVGPDLAGRLPPPTQNHMAFLTNPSRDSFYLRNTSPEEIKNLILALKNSSPGSDEISAKVLKHSCDFLIDPLSHVFNLSLINGVVPLELKQAKIHVTPIFKKGCRETIGNYRPISILPCMSKILERLVYNRLTTFCERNSSLSDMQFGFRERHSTSCAVAFLVNEIIKAYEMNQMTLGVFIDLQKAFDTIDHRILLDKLYHYGIRGIAHDWFASYLCDRTQYVSILGAQSDQRRVSCGVPQGSILGPLLFILYINDFTHFSNNCSKVLFADDTNVFMSSSDITELFRSMSVELGKLSQWLIANKLSINLSKTHYILFWPGRKSLLPNPKLEFDGHVLEGKHNTQFLEVKLNARLSCLEHSSYVRHKIAKNIGIINKVRHILSPSTGPE